MQQSQATVAELDDSFPKYMPFIAEIRRRLFFTLSVFFIGGILGFIYYERIIKFILRFFAFEGVNIVFTSPFQFITLAFSSAFLVGIVVVFPVLVYQLLSFLKPALNEKEYKTIITLIPVSLFLFLLGFGFGVMIMRYVILLFYEKSLVLEVGNFLDISLLVSQIIVTSAFMGLAFQTPIVLTILLKLGILKYQTLVKHRLTAWSGSLIFAALLPPTDLLSLALLFLPLALLFEATLLVNKWILKSHLL